ncbi:MAG: hypothetical protein AB7Q17_12360 [Phycisphaerae bacterium]
MWILTIILAILGGVIIVNVVRAIYLIPRRAYAFRDRSSLEPQEWFSKYHAIAPEHRAAIMDLLSGIGSAMGISWTMLRPHDDLGALMSSSKWYWITLGEDLDAVFEDWVDRHGLIARSQSVGDPPTQLNDLLTYVITLFQPDQQRTHAAVQ